MLELLSAAATSPTRSRSRPGSSHAADLEKLAKKKPAAEQLHLRIPRSPLIIVGDPSHASAAPLHGHVEVRVNPASAAAVEGIRISLIRVIKAAKPAAKTKTGSILGSLGRNHAQDNTKNDAGASTQVEEITCTTLPYTSTSNRNSNSPPSNASAPPTTLLPFTLPVPGHLPASATTALGSISYFLFACATPTTATSSAADRRIATATPLALARHVSILPPILPAPPPATDYFSCVPATGTCASIPVSPATSPAAVITPGSPARTPAAAAAVGAEIRPANVVFHRRFPDARLTTRLTVPGVVRPAGAFACALLLRGTARRAGRGVVSRLRVVRVEWRVEERTRVLSIASGGGGVAAPVAREKRCAERKIAAGKWAPGKEAGGGAERGGSVDEDEEVEIRFDVALPASAKAVCGIEPDPEFGGLGVVGGVGEVLPPPPADRVQQRQQEARSREHSPERNRDFSPSSTSGERIALAVSHVLVVELITTELKYDIETGERANLTPWRQRKYGAVYDLSVSEWDTNSRLPSGLDGGEAQMFDLYPEPIGEVPPAYDEVTVEN